MGVVEIIKYQDLLFEDSRYASERMQAKGCNEGLRHMGNKQNLKWEPDSQMNISVLSMPSPCRVRSNRNQPYMAARGSPPAPCQ